MSVNENTAVAVQQNDWVVDTVINATGLKCPLPLLKLKQALRDCNIDHYVQLLSSDEGSLRDVPKWIDMSGLELTQQTIDGEGITSFIVKKTSERSRG